jgi:hypothetical protein
MPNNLGIKIDALKFNGAFLRNLIGKTQTKRCLIIPVDENPNIFLGEKGCYMNFTAVEVQNPQYGDTHLIKGDIPRDVYEKLSEEERKAQPVFGNVRPIKPREKAVTGSITMEEGGQQDDLPF